MFQQSEEKKLLRPKNLAPQNGASRQPAYFLLRNGNARVCDILEGSLKLENLTWGANFNNSLEAVVATVEPGFSCWEGKTCGGGKWYHILEGTLEVIANEESHVLGEGDSIYFESDIPHIWRNPGEKPARILVLSLAPSTMFDQTGALV